MTPKVELVLGEPQRLGNVKRVGLYLVQAHPPDGFYTLARCAQDNGTAPSGPTWYRVIDGRRFPWKKLGDAVCWRAEDIDLE